MGTIVWAKTRCHHRFSLPDHWFRPLEGYWYRPLV